jgi:hypothetical protein
MCSWGTNDKEDPVNPCAPYGDNFVDARIPPQKHLCGIHVSNLTKKDQSVQAFHDYSTQVWLTRIWIAEQLTNITMVNKQRTMAALSRGGKLLQPSIFSTRNQFSSWIKQGMTSLLSLGSRDEASCVDKASSTRLQQKCKWIPLC